MTNLLEEILDLLIQKRPPADDPTGQATLTAWIEVHDIAGRQIFTHTAILTPPPTGRHKTSKRSTPSAAHPQPPSDSHTTPPASTPSTPPRIDHLPRPRPPPRLTPPPTTHNNAHKRRTKTLDANRLTPTHRPWSSNTVVARRRPRSQTSNAAVHAGPHTTFENSTVESQSARPHRLRSRPSSRERPRRISVGRERNRRTHPVVRCGSPVGRDEGGRVPHRRQSKVAARERMDSGAGDTRLRREKSPRSRVLSRPPARTSGTGEADAQFARGTPNAAARALTASSASVNGGMKCFAPSTQHACPPSTSNRCAPGIPSTRSC